MSFVTRTAIVILECVVIYKQWLNIVKSTERVNTGTKSLKAFTQKK